MWVCGPTSAAGSGGVRFPRVGGVGVKTGIGGGCASPLWIPAFAGVTRDGGGTPGRTRDAPRAAPLPWVPARAGTTMGGVVGCVGAEGLVSGWGPALAGGRFSNRPYDRIWGESTRAGVMRGLPVRPVAWVPFEWGPSGTGALRQAQGERNCGGARAVGCGGCDGGRRRRRAAPLPWIPVFAGTTMGGVMAVGAGGRRAPFVCPQDRPFDRLRANGFGKRACGGVWGMRWGTETPRASPLPWVPVFTGTTMGGVVVGKRWWWWRAPFECPQDRLRQG